MNKYAEGWNWSLVQSGGGKKKTKKTTKNKKKNKDEQRPCNLMSGVEAWKDPWETLSIVSDDTLLVFACAA